MIFCYHFVRRICKLCSNCTIHSTLCCQYLRWFPHNIRAIMAKTKLPKNPHSSVIFWIKVRSSYQDLSSQADPARENWTWSFIYFTLCDTMIKKSFPFFLPILKACSLNTQLAKFWALSFTRRLFILSVSFGFDGPPLLTFKTDR